MERYRVSIYWQRLEKVALNILYIPNNTKKIQLAYKSKNNLTCDKQVILLMITNGEKWHYLTVKDLPGLLRGITSTPHGDFYCLNCFLPYRTINKFELDKKYVKIMIIVVQKCLLKTIDN